MTTSNIASLAWAQTWQLTLLIVVVSALARLFCRRRPHLAHVLWLVVLAKCLTPPLIASTGSVFCWLQPARTTTGSAGEAPEFKRAANSKEGQRSFLSALADPSAFATNRNVGDLQAASVSPAVRPPFPIILIDNPESTTDRLTSRFGDWLRWGGGLWLLGSSALIGVAVVRWAACLRTIRHAGIESRPDLDELVAKLSRRLRVGRRVRLVVTGSRIGPAVVRLFRPTILLPTAIVQGKSPCELEAILAHELIHVRRGDLWTGVVQVVAQGVWWFHPLVWLANRRATRAAEACCDEEVIAELRCDPASYAGSLLEVLELKRRLVSVPAFPGMRPVDVTRERLERIMQLEQGCRPATPWWCWIVLVVTAAATLPGAALVVSAEDEKPKEQQRASDTPSGSETVNSINASADGDRSPAVPQSNGLFYQMVNFSYKEKATGKTKQSLSISVPQSSAGGQAPRSLSLTADQLDFEQSGPNSPLMRVKFRDRVQMTFEGAEFTADDAVVSFATRPLAPNKSQEAFGVRLTGNVSWTFGKWNAGAEVVQLVWRESREGDSTTLRLTDLMLDGLLQIDAYGYRIRAERGAAVYVTTDTASQANAAVPRTPDRMTVAGNVEIWSRTPERQYSVLRGKLFVLEVQNETIKAHPLESAPVRGREADVESSTAEEASIRPPQSENAQQDSGGAKRPLRPNESVTRLRLAPRPQALAGTGVNSNARLVGTVALAESKKVVKEKPAAPGGHEATDGIMSVVSYVVADLITPHVTLNLTVSPTDDAKPEDSLQTPGEHSQSGYQVHQLLPGSARQTRDEKKADYMPLVDLIQSSVAPETWMGAGGQGSIRPYGATLSLVVRNTQKVHDEIAELLQQLRQIKSLQALLNIEIFYHGADASPRSLDEIVPLETAKRGVDLTADQLRGFREYIKTDERKWIAENVKLPLHNGQSAELILRRLWRAGAERPPLMQLNQVIGADTSVIRLNVAVGAANAVDALGRSRTFIVKNRQPLLLDVTDDIKAGRLGLPDIEPLAPSKLIPNSLPAERRRSVERTLLLITPEIAVHNEAEEVLPVGDKKAP